MSSLGDQLLQSLAFALDLRGRNPVTFVREVEAEDARIVGRYVPRTETLRSWDICGSNVRLNRVFELNRLPYGGYPGDGDVVVVDRRGKGRRQRSTKALHRELCQLWPLKRGN
jgi:hypothetical protein